MAGTLNLTVVVSYLNNGISAGSSAFERDMSDTITMTGTAITHNVQNVGTAEEALALGDATAGTGYAYFINLDPTNYIEIGKATGSYQIKLLAGECALLRMDAWTAPVAKANTAAVDLEYCLFAL